MAYIDVTKEQFDKKMQHGKGWICNVSGNEYVYDYHLKRYPIIIKVASTVRTDINVSGNKGADAIRVHAVQKETTEINSKIISGLLKARKVYRTVGWRDNLEKMVVAVIIASKVIYNQHRR